MAEEEEVIILEEGEEEADGNAASSDAAESDENTRKSGQKERKRLYLLIALAALVVLLLLILVIVLIARKNDAKPARPVDTQALAKKIATSKKLSPLSTPSEIEKMIKKANLLYERGDKKEALSIFEQIATYSASISYYNLGVAQMRQEHYKEAIESFKKAIQNGENRTISALNAASCALRLGDRERFDYYLQMAEASLPDSYGSSLYSYLYALVNYYKGNYFEILGALHHPLTKQYTRELGALGAIAYTVYDRPEKAIGLIESNAAPLDEEMLGLLYARIGEYAMAAQNLRKALDRDGNARIAKALALVELKNRRPQKSADLIKKLETDYKVKEDTDYPIAVALSPSVYEIDAAQRRFGAENLFHPPNSFRLLFEFAPFKVFNAAQTINYIRKGNASIYVDEAPEAARYLSRSSSISHVNLLISRAIKEALDHRLHKANALLKEAMKRYPNHSILHYNLGLTYAQLGDYIKAHEHFLRSYHLNTTNYLSGLFALMCEEIIHKKIPQIEQFVSDDLKAIDKPTRPQRFYKALYYYYQGNIAAASSWLQEEHDNRPVYLLFDLLVDTQMGDWERATEDAAKLRDRMPKDVLANILYLRTRYRELPIKRFSTKAIVYLKKHPLDLSSVYYGSPFTRLNYISLRHVTGTLYPFKEKLEKKLLTETRDPTEIIESLALVNIYLKDFEEAYTLLNQLVDKYGIQDSRTLFLTAVAAIGADHHATAAALLELAKLTDPDNMESRYALGLLYLEEGNLEAAAIQFSKIPNGRFASEFFDFDVIGYKRKEGR